MPQKGTVYLVGAGPGDYGLLTIRAKELIEQADVLVYDNLVNPRIVSLCAENCEKIYVGKSGAHHSMEQDDINRLLVVKAKEGGIIVRLKGGDPYIFGRGGEEALELADAGIRFELVNGISSAYAVPTFAGIPVTHRGIAASVAFITGHEDPTKEDSDLHWDRLATAVQTLVFLMGVKNIPLITSELIKNGRSPETPVAVIRRGTYPTQQTVTGTLENIEQKVREAGIKPPAIIVVGEVVSLREKISWFDTRPLFGKSIVVTRSREQSSDLVAGLLELGARVIEAPSIKIIPPEDRGPVTRALNNLGAYDWIVFTSANGVDYFFRYLGEAGLDSRALAGSRVCAIGPGTANRLLGRGITADLVPARFISSGIIEELAARDEIKGKKFLLPRADIAPGDLSRELAEKGAALVDDITIYCTVREDIPPDSETASLLQNRAVDCVTFTSSSTAKNFASILNGLGVTDFSGFRCAAIGPITAETARGLGFSVDCASEEHSIPGLIRSLIQFFNRG
ncbi:MAG TPA: uroporphyrinogen-III C-methyltransferase [Spirochaetota bacterium]|nr:uroporphyrinogen-III C-methyltransferase [Spirochaetota bacterium]HPI89478.1 uroporphyrinogen-III C-methyltransferase [Spirochaetota bacterium]HPR49335.1 uroporphyrinogen-III C-methyltransferase [Spirochaetota bacterium]